MQNQTLFLFLFLFLFCGKFFSQNNGAVGINTSTPNANSVLDVVSNNNDKGILIPRLTEAQRDAIVINPATDDGLTIFNTTEDCYNYWSLADNEWKSVCGQIGKSVFTVDCANTKAMGTYIQGKELTASNYLSVSVNVTKIGNYTITGTTTNGYNFYGTGVFMNTGIQTVQVPGQGVPSAIQIDNVQLSANGVDVTCTPAVTVDVLSPAATYTMSCGSATVNGVYKVGTALTASNTITLPVNVSALGSYTVTTNTVDGISFSGSGTFTSTGNQNITLSGMGTPSSTSVKTLTITSDSKGGTSTTCTVNVIVVIPKKRILTLGVGIYNAGTNGTYLNSMITSSNNFGTNANSTVKFEGWEIINGPDDPTAAYLSTYLTGANPVDIVITGHGGYIGAGSNEAQVIADYLANKGIVITFNEFATEMQPLFRTVFNDPGITATQAGAGGAGTVKQFGIGLSNDPIINGPFGNLAGKYWGEDCSETLRINNLPSNEIIVYSNGIYNNTLGSSNNITSFRHATLNLVWIGDGGFVSNNNSTTAGATCYPFLTDANNRPIPRPNFGSTNTTINNSIFVANALAWAIKEAEFNGINTQ
ncbi:hypothetical protein [Chryseobacterium oryctis]|uniref:Uncharacterized protein n=1 Tax=Chryseobacterium oryctis TaxID=2952618 RepID=A0ABT3HL22_9FLAO|nr:hypothetical protein [Chryseobacterium oryctis]MCW3160466.1 hypothetical protein [Chryseobacterium oryctis]